jgi:hypothetical protein
VFRSEPCHSRLVTPAGGNSDFSAVGSEVPGPCPPHTFLSQGGPAISLVIIARASCEHGKKLTPERAFCLE